MKNVQLFNVCPAIPPQLAFLEKLSRNMWWTWSSDALQLFLRINPPLWKQSGYCPMSFLNLVPQKRLEALVEDEAFMSHMGRVERGFEEEVSAGKPEPGSHTLAYFSLEYGIHESVRLYSGGLGALAGDHMKAASDMKLPLVAVGLMYRQGYFQQYLNSDGWQQEHYPENEIHHMPIAKALDRDGKEVIVQVALPDGLLKATVWLLQVGRIPLFLLDANIPDNPHPYRSITDQLYGGDRRMRLRQELLLGVGGFRALTALGYNPRVFHINEGHAAFLTLARIEHLVKQEGLDLSTALEIIPRTAVFTTHTPVPAGNETFALDLLLPHLSVLGKEMGIAAEDIVAWSRSAGDVASEPSMTVLGLRMSEYCNGVSRLHGRVARTMWAHLWPGRAEDEVPVRHITNGIHVASWLSTQNVELFDRYVGPGWRTHPGAQTTIERLAHIPDEELWRTHELGRSRLVRMVREHAERQYAARNATKAEIAQTKTLLDHDALTIGFARRFATYKRATLLLRHPERLEELLTNEERPVQIVFAGKAHPADDHGKDFIRQIVHFARKANVRRRVVFLENYDIGLARRMVQGVDVWLNTPRRPLEASGTSGMKAAVNGGLNVSVLDGWWCEGYTADCGWAIGSGEEYDDPEFQDSVESQALFNLLENDVLPTFYDRADSEIPLRWIHMMRNSMRMGLLSFTSHRMVAEYETRFYRPALAAHETLAADNWDAARKLVAQHRRLEERWKDVRIASPVADADMSKLHVGDSFTLTTQVHLGDLRPDEVDVEIYYGPVNSENHIIRSHVDVVPEGTNIGNGDYSYRHVLPCQHTGRFAFTARVTPRDDTWTHAMPGFITWAND
jgi:glycogen phosphorylase